MNRSVCFACVYRLSIALGLLLVMAAVQPLWAAPGDPKDSSAIEVSVVGEDNLGNSASARNGNGAFAVVWITRDVSQYGISKIWARSYTTQGQPRGPRFMVATVHGDPYSNHPDVGIDADGNIVVVWVEVTDVDDGQFTHFVKGRRFDASGTPLGPVFEVAQATPGAQELRLVDRLFGARDYDIDLDGANVAMAPDGRFAVAWSRYAYADNDRQNDYTDVLDAASVDYQINIRRYDANGVPREAEPYIAARRRVPSVDLGLPVLRFPTILLLTSSREFSAPKLAVNAAGEFVVVWTYRGLSGVAILGIPLRARVTRVYARRFTSGSTLQSGPRRLIAGYRSLAYTQLPAVDIAGDGTYAVTWMQCSRSKIRRSEPQPCTIKFRRMGSGSGAEVKVADVDASANPEVGLAGDGTLMVGWERHARIFGAQDQALTPTFEITQMDGEVDITSINSGGAPGFLATWDQLIELQDPFDLVYSVFARRFASE